MGVSREVSVGGHDAGSDNGAAGIAERVTEDVKGGFNNVIGQEVLDAVAGSCKKEWCKWLVHFFRPRNFEVEWDGKIRRRGSCDVGVPQGSPLSPVVFLIWMAPILEKMAERIRQRQVESEAEDGGNKMGRCGCEIERN